MPEHRFEIGNAFAQRSVIDIHLLFHLREVGGGNLFQGVVSATTKVLHCFTTHISQTRNVRLVDESGDKRYGDSSGVCEANSTCSIATHFEEVGIRCKLPFFQRRQILGLYRNVRVNKLAQRSLKRQDPAQEIIERLDEVVKIEIGSLEESQAKTPGWRLYERGLTKSRSAVLPIHRGRQ